MPATKTLVRPNLAILPVAALRQRFPELWVEEYGRGQIADIVRLKGPAMHGMALSIWNRVVSFRTDAVDPQAIAKWVRTEDPRLHQRIERIIGKRVIQDLYYGHAKLDVNGEALTVAEATVACVYPNDLHIADVEFSNPHQPIPEAERLYQYQHYRGLGLLSSFLQAAEAAAKRMGCRNLTLTAADGGLMDMFAGYGFHVEESWIGQQAHQSGFGFPMERPVG
jgi:GNAT superfamily N-acetyltransferase